MSKIFDAYAEYYDLVYDDKDYDLEVAYVLSLLKAQGITSGRILELGCGTGRHAMLLAKAGFHVTGIDKSALMIEEAQRKIPIQLEGQLDFVVTDICSHRSETTYDAVIALFHVASYLTEDEEQDYLFGIADRQLKDGGVLLFDYWHGPGVLNDLPSVRVKRVVNARTQVFRISEPEIDHIRNTVDVKFSIFVTNRAANTTSILAETHKMRYLFVNEIVARARANNLYCTETKAWMTDRAISLQDWQAVTLCTKVPAKV